MARSGRLRNSRSGEVFQRNRRRRSPTLWRRMTSRGAASIQAHAHRARRTDARYCTQTPSWCSCRRAMWRDVYHPRWWRWTPMMHTPFAWKWSAIASCIIWSESWSERWCERHFTLLAGSPTHSKRRRRWRTKHARCWRSSRAHRRRRECERRVPCLPTACASRELDTTTTNSPYTNICLSPWEWLSPGSTTTQPNGAISFLFYFLFVFVTSVDCVSESINQSIITFFFLIYLFFVNR